MKDFNTLAPVVLEGLLELGSAISWRVGRVLAYILPCFNVRGSGANVRPMRSKKRILRSASMFQMPSDYLIEEPQSR
jgi:hypothetical protein